MSRITMVRTDQPIPAEKCDLYSAKGINNRIRRSINESKRKAA